MQLLNRNFIMVLIGQIISIFGNAIIRFALPLYLLQETGSAALFGTVTAIAFIPSIILMPIGGIIADRVNKRNIMVVLDFATAGILTIFVILVGHVNLVTLMLVVMILLYSIQSAYSPAVSSAIPLLVGKDSLVRANSLVNTVASVSGLLGPALGGVLYSFLGIDRLIYIGIVCFLISATMEIFIVIPFTRESHSEGAIRIAINDLKDSFNYVSTEQRIIFKICLIAMAINALLSSCITIGIPVIITGKLGFSTSVSSIYYGYVEAVFSAGSLAGGIAASILANRLKIEKLHLYLLAATLSMVPVAVAMGTNAPGIVKYYIIMISAFFFSFACTIFNIRIISEVQFIVPERMLGKIYGFVTCICMCSMPLGQALYGVIFQYFGDFTHLIIGLTLIIMVFICISAGRFFKPLKKLHDEINNLAE